MLMLMDMFPLLALIWPIVHGITGAYIGDLYGLQWWGGGVGIVVGILTSIKISKHPSMTITDISASLFLLLTFLFATLIGSGLMLGILIFISVLPLIRWLVLKLLDIDAAQHPDE